MKTLCICCLFACGLACGMPENEIEETEGAVCGNPHGITVPGQGVQAASNSYAWWQKGEDAAIRYSSYPGVVGFGTDAGQQVWYRDSTTQDGGFFDHCRLVWAYAWYSGANPPVPGGIPGCQYYINATSGQCWYNGLPHVTINVGGMGIYNGASYRWVESSHFRAPGGWWVDLDGKLP